jgi:elongation factor Tu
VVKVSGLKALEGDAEWEAKITELMEPWTAAFLSPSAKSTSLS